MQKLTKKEIVVYFTKTREVLPGEIAEVRKIRGRTDMSVVRRKWNEWHYLHLFWELPPQKGGVQQIRITSDRKITIVDAWADRYRVCIFYKDRKGGQSAFYDLDQLGL